MRLRVPEIHSYRESTVVEAESYKNTYYQIKIHILSGENSPAAARPLSAAMERVAISRRVAAAAPPRRCAPSRVAAALHRCTYQNCPQRRPTRWQR